jgi:hypothetical protein
MAKTATQSRDVTRLYGKLHEQILGRDQRATSDVFYDLVRAERPLDEMLLETIKIASPYIHVPYHQRIDNGVFRFVNNDHCLLSARAALQLRKFVGGREALVPMAQTMWYVPTGLDPWNQLLGNIPGHYARNRFQLGDPFPEPTSHIADQEPLYLDGTLDERLNEWLRLVQVGDVVNAYRVFLGLVEEEDREKVFAQLVFAGLIDVQDRMYYNRSYTTGHRAYRARSVVELCDAVGWENAHPIIYAGVPDIAVGPHWYSSYEMAGEVAWIVLSEAGERQKSSIGASPEQPPERRLLANSEPLSAAESAMLVHALTRSEEPAAIDAISQLLLGGKAVRSIVDAIQVAASQLVIETGDPRNFAMPQHCFQYTSTLGWFMDRFRHPHRIKLLYVAASFINQTARWLRAVPGNAAHDTTPTPAMTALPARDLLVQLDDAQVRRSADEAVALTRAYIDSGEDRRPLIRTLALGAAKHGNDTHNQELGLCFVESYTDNSDPGRDRLLLACAQHTAGHIKYGDSLEPYRRFAEAFDIDNRQSSQGDADPSEALLDD